MKQPPRKTLLLNEAIQGLTQAIGASGQLTHARNPHWMRFREVLETVKIGLQNLARSSTPIVPIAMPSSVMPVSSSDASSPQSSLSASPPSSKP